MATAVPEAAKQAGYDGCFRNEEGWRSLTSNARPGPWRQGRGGLLRKRTALRSGDPQLDTLRDRCAYKERVCPPASPLASCKLTPHFLPPRDLSGASLQGQARLCIKSDNLAAPLWLRRNPSSWDFRFGAYSVVLSGAYKDDDVGDTIVYTGQCHRHMLWPAGPHDNMLCGAASQAGR